MKQFVSLAGSWKSARFALAFALLFAVGTLGFYACSDREVASKEVKPEKVVRNNKNVMSISYIIVPWSEFDDPGSPSCECSNWACGSKGYCTDGKTCSCTCEGIWGRCSCTLCSSPKKGQISMSSIHRDNRLSLEQYLRAQNITNLTQAADILASIRTALENNDVEAYFNSLTDGENHQANFSAQEKTIINRWFSDNNINVSI